jgi:hypothetical protein
MSNVNAEGSSVNACSNSRQMRKLIDRHFSDASLLQMSAHCASICRRALAVAVTTKDTCFWLSSILKQ